MTRFQRKFLQKQKNTNDENKGIHINIFIPKSNNL